MNKKGQLAFLIIVLVALVLCITTLVVFTRFGADFKDTSITNSKISSGSDFGRVYVFGETVEMAGKAISSGGDVKANFQELAAEKSKFKVEESGNFFRKIDRGEFVFEGVGIGYIFKMPGIIVKAKGGNSEIQRTFEACMLFDGNGAYLSKASHLPEYGYFCPQ